MRLVTTARAQTDQIQAGALGLALPGRRRSGPLGGQGATRSERPWGLLIAKGLDARFVVRPARANFDPDFQKHLAARERL